MKKLLAAFLLSLSLAAPSFADQYDYLYLRGLAVGADVALATGPGILHSVSCWGADAAATAGDIAIRDGVAAGGGTILLDFQIAASLLLPQTVLIDIPFTNGIFVDYTTTNDVNCTLSYKRQP